MDPSSPQTTGVPVTTTTTTTTVVTATVVLRAGVAFEGRVFKFKTLKANKLELSKGADSNPQAPSGSVLSESF